MYKKSDRRGMEIKRPIGIDLFAGAGGMTLGFEQAGFDILGAVELDPIHCATHEFNFPFWSILCEDVAEISGEDIRSRSKIGNQEIDVVFGGSPCQGFSVIGKRALNDPRNSLVFHYLRLVLELKPKYFVLENVPGLGQGKHTAFLFEVIEAFEESGYQVQKNYRVLNAANYGVPQDRGRLFILGCRQGLSLPQYPPAITNPSTSKTSIYFVYHDNLPYGPTVADAIVDLPDIEDYPELEDKDWVIAEYGTPSSYARKLRCLEKNQDDYSYHRLFDSKILTGSIRTNHGDESTKRFQQTIPGKQEQISHLYKLDLTDICNTIRAGTARNKGSHTSARPIHPIYPRCITVREAARLHSYPDWFRFHVTKWHGFRLVGNSVPPLLAKAVAAEIIKALQIVPIQPQQKMELGNENLLHINLTQAAKLYGVSNQIIGPRNRNKLDK